MYTHAVKHVSGLYKAVAIGLSLPILQQRRDTNHQSRGAWTARTHAQRRAGNPIGQYELFAR